MNEEKNEKSHIRPKSQLTVVISQTQFIGNKRKL